VSDVGQIDLTIQVNLLGLDSFAKVSSAMQGLGRETTNAADKAGNAQSRWESFTKGLQTLEEHLDAAFRLMFRVREAGQSLMGVGEEMTGWLKTAVDAWGEFEFKLNRAAGALGIFDRMSPMYDKLQKAI
jgi:hypothetical protein